MASSVKRCRKSVETPFFIAWQTGGSGKITCPETDAEIAVLEGGKLKFDPFEAGYKNLDVPSSLVCNGFPKVVSLKGDGQSEESLERYMKVLGVLIADRKFGFQPEPDRVPVAEISTSYIPATPPRKPQARRSGSIVFETPPKNKGTKRPFDN